MKFLENIVSAYIFLWCCYALLCFLVLMFLVLTSNQFKAIKQQLKNPLQALNGPLNNIIKPVRNLSQAILKQFKCPLRALAMLTYAKSRRAWVWYARICLAMICDMVCGRVHAKIDGYGMVWYGMVWQMIWYEPYRTIQYHTVHYHTMDRDR